MAGCGPKYIQFILDGFHGLNHRVLGADHNLYDHILRPQSSLDLHFFLINPRILLPRAATSLRNLGSRDVFAHKVAMIEHLDKMTEETCRLERTSCNIYPRALPFMGFTVVSNPHSSSPSLSGLRAIDLLSSKALIAQTRHHCRILVRLCGA